MQKSFDEIEGYDEMIVLRGIRFESHCEHHMAPISAGRGWPTFPTAAWSASASSREWSRPMQAPANPGADDGADRQHHRTRCSSRGGRRLIKATHHCMTTRGVHKPDADLVTSRMLGCFRDNSELRQEFLSMTV